MSELWEEKNLSINKFFLFDHSYDFVLPFITHFMGNHHFLIENNVGVWYIIGLKLMGDFFYQ